MPNRIQPPSHRLDGDRGLLVTAARAAELRAASAEWASWTLTPPQACQVELLGSGALAPLRGFMGRADYDSVRSSRQLATGENWPAPIVLEVSETFVARTDLRIPVALRDREGVFLAALWVEDVWSTDGPTDCGEPARRCLSGQVEVIEPRLHYDFQQLRRTPGQMRQEFAARGWNDVTALRVSASADLRSTAELVTAAVGAGKLLLVHAVVGEIDIGDAAYYGRIRELRAIVESAAAHNVILSIRPQASFESGAHARALENVVDARYGCHEVVLPDDAIDPAHSGGRHPGRGLTLFLTGLSGSGKSTIANVLLVRALERGGRSVTLLDGDMVRTHLSSELGFSREHRNLNVRRIGFVASEIAKHGGIAICAPIAPYDNVRKEVRAMVEAVGDFLLVHVATPLAVCERRDRKGLYAKARAGLLKEFTGVSDPYEPPLDAEIVVDTTEVGAEQAADLILEYLERHGYLQRL